MRELIADIVQRTGKRALENVVVQGTISKSHDYPIGIFWYDFADDKLYYNAYIEGMHHSTTLQYSELADNKSVVRGRLFKDGDKNIIVVYEGDFDIFPMKKDKMQSMANKVQDEAGIVVSHIVNEVGEDLLERKDHT